MTRRILYVAGLVVLLLAIPPYVEARGLECADYISSPRGKMAARGHLIGTETVTETTTHSMSGTFGKKGVGTATPTMTKTTTRKYEVGYYKMEDGSTQKVDCRNYTIQR
jgi:hypothetical protein